MRRAHVVGAGLAGLSAAIALVRAGYEVRLSEAAAHAGGRCRSYHDPRLGLTIDNGNHLVLSGNRAVADYLQTIGAGAHLAGPDEARFDFADLRDGRRWTIHLNNGPLPWWIGAAARRAPATSLCDHLAIARLLRARRDARVEDVIPTSGELWRRMIEPLLVSALNTSAAGASASLAGAVLRETLVRGGRASRPLVATSTLSAAFVEPAVSWVRRHGARVEFGRRLKRVAFAAGAVSGLGFSDREESVAADEPVVLAVPAWTARELVPGLTVPDRQSVIVNAHFALPRRPGDARILGVVGGLSHWIFAFPDRYSVTISAADALGERDREELARLIWREVSVLHGLSSELPPWQIVREQRATFAATPQQDALRPPARTAWRNLALAGDWVQTGLPATIESAIRSGRTAAGCFAAGRSRIAA